MHRDTQHEIWNPFCEVSCVDRQCRTHLKAIQGILLRRIGLDPSHNCHWPVQY
jgi:hypothetical protein